jgi:1H-pyrrole-2-carbonyl-[peptidyl-carrier protein] chlorinase
LVDPKEPSLSDEPKLDADVIIIGGGPAGSALGTFLAQDGHRAMILEKDIHPRDHVGESLVPSTNLMFDRMGVLGKIEDAGFIPKPGTAWNAPRSALWKFIEVWLFSYPIRGNTLPYTFHVERDVLDAILLRHAHESGAKVLQGVKVREVIFEDGRAVGVRAEAADGWERVLRAKVVADTSGRRCFMATQLGMKKKDPNFNQFCTYTWYRGVKPPPERLRGFGLFYFLGLPKGWGWQFQLRDDKWSIGVVVDKADFQKSGKDYDEFFETMVRRNRTFAYAMKDAERIRPWWVEGDYSYKVEKFSGPGWILAGDALRFVDPIFSSGVDVALYSALYAYEAITEAWKTGDEPKAFDAFHHRVTDGVDVWYDLIDSFYKLQNLVSRYATRPVWKEKFIRALQGNPYLPETQERSRDLLEAMDRSYETVMADPNNLMRPWSFDDILRKTLEWKEGEEPEARFLPCPACGGQVRLDVERELLVCRNCGREMSMLSQASRVGAEGER